MPEEIKEPAPVSAEIQEVVRNLVSAIRAVKLYPPNNPIYAQSVHKAFESLEGCLQTTPNFAIGVQKTYFLFEDSPIGKETQINRAIAQDIFAKGVREFVFLEGLSEDELLACFQSLALTPEETAMRGGIVSILWERGVTHIKVTEAILEEVISAGVTERPSYARDEHAAKLDAAVASKELRLKGRTLIVGDIVDDPKGFSSQMVEIAQETREEGQSVEDRLHELYQEVGRSIREEEAKDQEALFRGLAQSVLEMDEQYRDKLVSSKLYAHLDAGHLREQADGEEAQLPEELHEIVTGRFSRQWSVEQVASLLKQSSLQQVEPHSPPVPLTEVEALPITEEILAIARELNEYTADEMEALKAMGEVGTEEDILDASVRTLIFLLPMVKNEYWPGPPDRDTSMFNAVVHQLEIMLDYLLKNGEYDLATIIVRAYHIPVEPEFRPRLADAIQKASSRDVISAVVTDMRKSRKGTPPYMAAHAYLTVLDQEATTVLMEALAAEKDRTIRRSLIDILKELGKNQISSIGQRINDKSWFVVRNVVSILGESGSEEALGYLEKVISHPQIQIRHEVIKGLITIGGKNAAGLLVRFLKDKDADVQLQTLRAMAVVHGAGVVEARALQEYLRERRLGKKENELTVEGIRSLEKIGDTGTVEFLKRYTRLRWWRSRRLQEQLRSAALSAIESLQRRSEDGGRAS